MLAGQRLLGSVTLVYPLLGKKTAQRTSSETGCPKGNVRGIVSCS